jgi:hypothetical protein
MFCINMKLIIVLEFKTNFNDNDWWEKNPRNYRQNKSYVKIKDKRVGAKVNALNFSNWHNFSLIVINLKLNLDYFKGIIRLQIAEKITKISERV